jgi:hypothetical protein
MDAIDLEQQHTGMGQAAGQETGAPQAGLAVAAAHGNAQFILRQQ